MLQNHGNLRANGQGPKQNKCTSRQGKGGKESGNLCFHVFVELSVILAPPQFRRSSSIGCSKIPEGAYNEWRGEAMRRDSIRNPPGEIVKIFLEVFRIDSNEKTPAVTLNRCVERGGASMKNECEFHRLQDQ
jgi:hypothetical protein